MKDKSSAVIIAVIFVLVAAAIILIAWGQKPAEDKAIEPPTEPVEIQTVTTEDFEMNYFSFGSGEENLVILPGASLNSVMLSADAVAAAYAGFTEKYTVYVFDCTNDWQNGYSVVQLAADTAQAMKQVGIEQADIFGCSLGGMIAQYIAINNPELAHKLVLASTMSRNNEISRATIREWKQLADSGDVVALNRKVFEKVYSEAYYGQYKDIFASLEGVGTADDMQRFSAMMGACLDMDSYDELGKISCPVLVMGSWQDNTLSASSGVELAEKLGCSLYMYSGYSHAVYDEAPDFKDRIMSFLAE